ncbi:AAA family ATPase [Limosilactobacillus fermentum]|uniref:AAA family ATPase n=1 Tax=Limosilactobacillus fermentum TaxID=1613 RepID=UPI001CA79606|nr:AAA family ATPase [Limosilactobacillus fermentum]QZY76118.1 AAA family ATPase [Limosilactobacillus fermentum]
MNNKFHISSVKVTGPGVRDSEVQFREGLNIVEGGSDTGKTSIVHCILYVFNKSWGNKNDSKRHKKFPFLDEYGYTQVVVTFKNKKGYITISREKDAQKVQVDSSFSGISSGYYSVNNTKRKNLNDILLEMLGMQERHQIPKNINYQTQNFSWKGISPLWYVDENDVIQANPIMLPLYNTQTTAFLSSLIFMITGSEIEIPEGIRDPKTKKAKDEATKGQLAKQLQESSSKIEEIHSQLAEKKYDNVEDQLQVIVDKIDKLNEQIYERVNNIHSIQQELTGISQQIEEMTVYVARFKNLRSEYIGDVKRLSFIVNGEQQLKHIQGKRKCPFCNQTINPKDNYNHTKAAQAELSRIIEQLESLEQSTNDVKNKKHNLEQEQHDKEEHLNQLSQKLQKEMKPELKSLRKQQENYQNYLLLKNKEEIYKGLISEWSDEINKIDNEKEKHPEYHPLEHLPENFAKKISDIVRTILIECDYAGLENVRFDIKNFEIEINGIQKSDNHGKGYRAFLNTVVNLAFREYMYENAMYSSWLDIIDTPFLGLEEAGDSHIPEHLKTGLLDYLISHQKEGQVILIENNKDLPQKSLSKEKVNVIEFESDSKRTGFLLDISK